MFKRNKTVKKGGRGDKRGGGGFPFVNANNSTFEKKADKLKKDPKNYA
jgi:hypothetical protein